MHARYRTPGLVLAITAQVLGCLASPGGSTSGTPVNPEESGGDGGLALLEGKMTALACNQYAAWGIALDETYVYWSNCGDGVNANGAILRVPKAGGAPATLPDRLSA
jgi:hypothetical protein